MWRLGHQVDANGLVVGNDHLSSCRWVSIRPTLSAAVLSDVLNLIARISEQMNKHKINTVVELQERRTSENEKEFEVNGVT